MIMTGTVEVELSSAVWRKSSRSGGGSNCVEIAMLGSRAVAVRDSKNPTGSVLLFTSAQWAAFLHGVRGGDFESE